MKGHGRLPPYGSYKTFRTFIEDLHTHEMPSRIDRSILARFSGTVGNQLLTGLRFLRLIDAEDRPTNELRALERAFGDPEGWSAALHNVLKAAYPSVIQIGLENATASQFVEAFKAFPGADEVRRRSEVFFLNAAKDAGLPISKRISAQKRLIINTIRRRKAERSPNNSVSEFEQDDDVAEITEPSIRSQSNRSPPAVPPKDIIRVAYDALSAVWSPGEMPDDVDAAVVTLLRYLRKKEAESKV